jgi:hypothetical protein
MLMCQIQMKVAAQTKLGSVNLEFSMISAGGQTELPVKRKNLETWSETETI